MNIEDIVREGKVTAVNESKRIAKVWFDALEIESDWLPVLINRDRIGSDVVEWDETQWTMRTTSTSWLSNPICQRSTTWCWCCTSLCSTGTG